MSLLYAFSKEFENCLSNDEYDVKFISSKHGDEIRIIPRQFIIQSIYITLEDEKLLVHGGTMVEAFVIADPTFHIREVVRYVHVLTKTMLMQAQAFAEMERRRQQERDAEEEAKRMPPWRVGPTTLPPSRPTTLPPSRPWVPLNPLLPQDEVYKAEWIYRPTHTLGDGSYIMDCQNQSVTHVSDERLANFNYCR
jgi:hypothetical protein